MSTSELSQPQTKSSGPQRVRLPETRQSLTHKFNIGGHEGYITAGLYEDGRVGEVFIKMAKEGSTTSGLIDTIAVLILLCLQYGVPIDKLVTKFRHTRFEPAGWTKNQDIPEATSVVDYIFCWLRMHFGAESVEPLEHGPSPK